MMSLTGTRVLVLAANLFEDSELLYPVLRLKEEQADVTVASIDGEPVTGKKGHGPFPVDAAIDEVDGDDFVGLVIPGGFAPDALRQSEPALELVRAFDQAGKPIAFICHAGWVPISAGIIDGRRATSVGAIKHDMVNAGCDWEDAEVVVDGNLISSRHPGDLGPWLRTIITALGGNTS
jgi:protease I